MNDKMHDVGIVSAIAIYQQKGVIDALAFMIRTLGMSFNEALAIIAAYDVAVDAVKAGILH